MENEFLVKTRVDGSGVQPGVDQQAGADGVVAVINVFVEQVGPLAGNIGLRGRLGTRKHEDCDHE